MEKDAVRGMNIGAKSAIRLELGGKVYYSCSEDCQKSFSRTHKVSMLWPPVTSTVEADKTQNLLWSE